MEFKHSPAPWNSHIKYLDYTIIRDANGKKITSLSYCCSEAGANLISAAPELLEALRELIHTHEYSLRIGYERIIELGGDCDSPELMINKDSSLNKAKAVIEKALGQQ